MSTCVKTIRFSLTASIISAVLTYLVSVNIEIGFLHINSGWLSNNFALTVFGGIFTGFFVMFLCEIQKYRHTKKETEQLLFTHAGLIYAQLRVIQVTLENLCKNPNETVTEMLLNGPANMLKNEAGHVGNLYFEPFLKENDFYKRHTQLQKWLLEDLARFVSNCVYLQIASNTDKIESIKRFGREGTITSSSTFTGATINRLLDEIIPLVQYADAYMGALDDYCNKRFHWPLRRTAVEMAFDLKETTLDDFLQKKVTP